VFTSLHFGAKSATLCAQGTGTAAAVIIGAPVLLLQGLYDFKTTPKFSHCSFLNLSRLLLC
jgi:hypothetical protein